MLLVKKCQFFHYLFLLKIWLEIRFNNVLERKETFLSTKQNFLKSQKSQVVKGVNPCFWLKNANSFFYLLLVKTRVEIRFNNVLDRKETFFEYKNKIFEILLKSQKWQFSKGVSTCVSFVKKQNCWKSQKSHFSKGVNTCFR